MPIQNRDLPAGTRLVADYKKTRFVCTVEAGEDGKLTYVLEDGKRFTSPSAAGSAVMGGTACNGWRFWTPESEAGEPKAATPTTAPKATRGRKRADSAEPPAPARTRRSSRKPEGTSLFKRLPDNEDGTQRWWCNACADTFTVEGDETPDACPKSHRADSPEIAVILSGEPMSE